MTSKMGILVKYNWCTGCHSCEMACQQEHGFPIGQGGVKALDIRWQIDGDNWVYDSQPMFSKQCNLCAERTAEGKLPACVHHCQAKCMEYGPVDELVEKLADERQVLFTI